MTIKETIRAEIERIRSEAVTASFGNDSYWLRSRVATCVDILAFLDTLPEQPVEGLEEEIARYLREECARDDEPSVSDVARHFAEWGASHAKTPTP